MGNVSRGGGGGVYSVRIKRVFGMFHVRDMRGKRTATETTSGPGFKFELLGSWTSLAGNKKGIHPMLKSA